MALESVSKLTDLVGGWGRSQKLMFVFVQFTYFMYGWQSLQLTFLVPDVKITCDTNTTNSTFSPCSEECPKVKYDHTEFQETLTEKLGLVCDRSWLQSFSTTVLMVAGMIMNLVGGDLSDRFGRRRVVICSLVPYILGSLFMLLPQNYAMFLVGVALVGMAYVIMANFSYVVLFELCVERHRALMGASIEIGFNLGAILLGGVAWALRHWFHLQLVNVALVCILSVCCFLPESVEWLMLKGRNKEAAEMVKKIIWVNGTPKFTDSEISFAVDKLSLIYQNKMASDTSKNSSIKDLFVSADYRIKTLCMCYFWFVAAFVFYSFSLNANVFGDNLFLSFILASVSSLPSNVIVILCLKIVGLKWIIVGCNACTAVVCYLYGVGEVLHGYKTASVVMGWFFTSPALVMLLPYTSDLFPTEVRGKAVGLGNFMSRLGAALAPFSKELGLSTRDYVPMLVFGSLCTLVVILIIRLGSGTKQFDLPRNLSDGSEDNCNAEDTNGTQIVTLSSKVSYSS